jgi:hypothetical protein
MDGRAKMGGREKRLPPPEQWPARRFSMAGCWKLAGERKTSSMGHQISH